MADYLVLKGCVGPAGDVLEVGKTVPLKDHEAIPLVRLGRVEKIEPEVEVEETEAEAEAKAQTDPDTTEAEPERETASTGRGRKKAVQ